jgi:hypothetical protein
LWSLGIFSQNIGHPVHGAQGSMISKSTVTTLGFFTVQKKMMIYNASIVITAQKIVGLVLQR